MASCAHYHQLEKISAVDSVYKYTRSSEDRDALRTVSPTVTIYQDVLRNVLYSRCPMFPSCSQYSQLAQIKFGKILALPLTFSRILTESDSALIGLPLIKSDNHLHFVDFP